MTFEFLICQAGDVWGLSTVATNSKQAYHTHEGLLVVAER